MAAKKSPDGSHGGAGKAGEMRGVPMREFSRSLPMSLLRAREALQQALEGLGAARMLELVALDLRIAVNAVGEIVGKTTTEDLLDSIFSQFCIGK